MITLDQNAPTVLIVHKDQILNPVGVNGGAEMASLALAKSLCQAGVNVFFAGNLDELFWQSIAVEHNVHQGICYLNLGPSYDTVRVFYEMEEVYQVKSYHLIVMCCAQALLESRYNEKIETRIFVDHEPSCNAFGVSPAVIARIADQVVSVSSAQKEQLIKSHCPAEKISIIPNGVNLETFTPGDINLRDHRKLVFAGALVVDKGVHLLVETYSLLKQKYSDLTLDIYGSAQMWSRENYFNLDYAKSLPSLTFHGAVNQHALANAFKHAGLCVLPSIYFDSFNMTCAEAQACGLPVIGSYHTGMRDIIIDGQSGILLKDVNRENLTAVCDALLANQAALKQMSQLALTMVRPKFDWALTAKCFLELLKV
ncbi:MAG: glycosyltransferase family 4 protein [Deltaproteobacteria bacterium]|nr:glycosyltransferase family 4 protein [Deltaproteobacteria bacterium]